MEIEGVEPRPQVAAFLLVPDERRAVIAEVTGEWGHVVRRVGEPQHMVPDEVAGRLVTEPLIVVVGRDNGGVVRG